MQASEFIRKTKDLTDTQDDHKVQLYIKAVFGALRDRISPGGASNLASQLPKEIKEMWDGGIIHNIAHSITGVDHLSREEFLAKVQNTAHLADIQAAEKITHAVFTTLKEQITTGEMHAVEKQLPDDLKQLWMEGRRTGGPYTSEKIGPSAAEVFRSDDQLKDDIEELLAADDEIDESTINVSVQQGKVRLTGRVRSEIEKESAEHAAKEALGTTEVVNELEVEGHG